MSAKYHIDMNRAHEANGDKAAQLGGFKGRLLLEEFAWPPRPEDLKLYPTLCSYCKYYVLIQAPVGFQIADEILLNGKPVPCDSCGHGRMMVTIPRAGTGPERRP